MVMIVVLVSAVMFWVVVVGDFTGVLDIDVVLNRVVDLAVVVVVIVAVVKVVMVMWWW